MPDINNQIVVLLLTYKHTFDIDQIEQTSGFITVTHRIGGYHL